ncbi:hypothetical protein GPECTOR_57g521 [Gonium pectorale]|uniref:Uncharacterized protein n=1 Tax=Gonium pectorale TaxID=33097 RepID=A0A150G5X7_GONPE|nr:hypothetical protein GPECTOR_57g521 [Gonium pectorale]|eukprot:KXZ45231.1 hypothetical protein GPECTOR_57g521 [Gonium pectorale]
MESCSGVVGGGGGARNARVSGGGGGGSFSSVRSDAELLALGGGRASLASTPMPGRGFVTLHGNPVFAVQHRSSAGVVGEGPIAEEDDDYEDGAQPLEEAESLELIGTTASSRLAVAVAAAAAAARSREEGAALAAPAATPRKAAPPGVPQAALQHIRHLDNPISISLAAIVALRERQVGAVPTYVRGSRHSSGGTLHSGGTLASEASPARHGGQSAMSGLDTPLQAFAAGLSPLAASSSRRSAHGIRTVAVAGGAAATPALAALPHPVDPAALAAAVASSGSGMVSGNPSRAGPPALSGSASGGVQYVLYDGPQATAAAGGSRPPPGLMASASIRRRASSGGIAVSLRAAAEAAISQLQAMNASSTSQSRRVLRKSTSSRGRRNYGGGTSAGSSADTAGSLAAAALAFYSAAGLGAAATPGAHRSSSMVRRTPGGMEVSGSGAAPEALVFRNLSPPLDRMLPTPRRYGGAGPSSAGRNQGALAAAADGSAGCGGAAAAAGFFGAAHLRRSAPGVPQSFLPPYGPLILGSGASPHANGNGSVPGAPTFDAPAARGHALRASTGSSPARAPTGSLHPPLLAVAPGDVPPIYAIHALVADAGGGGGAQALAQHHSRRSSAASPPGPNSQASPGHVSPALAGLPPAPPQPPQLHTTSHHSAGSSAAYARQPTPESCGGAASMTPSPSPHGPAVSAPGLFPRGQRSPYGAATVGGGPVSTGSQGLRSMIRSSMPQLAGAAGPGAEAAGSAAPSGPTGGGGAAGGAGRLRSSYQSLPDDVLVAAQVAARELAGPPGTSAAAAATAAAGGGPASGGFPTHGSTGPPPSSRGGRWRSPRTPTHGEEGAPLDKQSHPGDAAAAAAGGGGPGGGGRTESGAPFGGRTESGAPRGVGGDKEKDKDKDKENRPEVMAECYKITQQPADGMGGGANAVAQSITMIKYTNLKQELERAEEGEGEDMPVPTNMLLVPTVSVEVAIWSLGAFRLKGVTEPIKIVQVLPSSLEGRLSLLNKAGLNRGKARCIERRVSCLEVLQLQLPDVSRLTCVLASAGTPGDGASDDGGAQHDMYGRGTSMEMYGDGGGFGGGADAEGGAGGGMASGSLAQLGGGGGAGPSVSGSGAGPSTSSGGAAGRSSLGLGQATSPAEMAARGLAGIRGMPIRELESSDAGLPPISEVVTPASSPTLRSRDRLPGGSVHGSLSGALAEPREGGEHSGSGALSRRRAFVPPRPVTIPEAPSSPPRARPAHGPPPLPVDVPVLPAGWRASDSAVVASHGAAGLGLSLGGGGSGSGRQAAGGVPVHMRASEGSGGGGGGGGLAGALSAMGRAGGSVGGRYGRPPYRTQLSAESLGGGGDGDRVSARSGGGVMSSADGFGGGSHVAAASNARLSTGLLPSSLSYMAMRTSSRDAPAATLAAMLSAGMDVRSPGDSPHSTLRSNSRSGGLSGTLLGSGGDLALGAAVAAAAAAAAAAAGGSAASTAHGGLPQQMALALPDLASAAAAAGASASAAAAALTSTHGSGLLLPERSSAGTTTYGQAHSPLVIDRSSSGFNHFYSSSHTPGPALTDRSSSGRYPSGHYQAPHFTPSDRTSSGLQRSGHHTPLPLTDRSSSSRRISSAQLPPPSEASPPLASHASAGTAATATRLQASSPSGGTDGPRSNDRDALPMAAADGGAGGPGGATRTAAASLSPPVGSSVEWAAGGVWAPGPSRFVRATQQQHLPTVYDNASLPYGSGSDSDYEDDSGDAGGGGGGDSVMLRTGESSASAMATAAAAESSEPRPAHLPPELQQSLQRTPSDGRQRQEEQGAARGAALARHASGSAREPMRIPNATHLPTRTSTWSAGGAMPFAAAGGGGVGGSAGVAAAIAAAAAAAASAAAAARANDSGGAGSFATSPDSGAAATPDVSRIPTFGSLGPTAYNASGGASAGPLDFASLYDVTLSMRSSLAGSATIGGSIGGGAGSLPGGRTSNAGAGGGGGGRACAASA